MQRSSASFERLILLGFRTVAKFTHFETMRWHLYPGRAGTGSARQPSLTSARIVEVVWLKSVVAVFAAMPLLAQAQKRPSLPASQPPEGRVAATRIEVASIRPSNPASCREYPIIDSHNDRYDMKCVKTDLLLEMAYNGGCPILCW